MKLDDLSPEIREQVRACKSSEELAALAKKLGGQMTDEQLDAIAGGGWGECSCTCDPDVEWWG